MKNLANFIAFVAAMLLTSSITFAQLWNPTLQNFRPNNQKGISMFEEPQDSVKFEGMKMHLGGSFAMQFQGISQEYANSTENSGFVLQELGSNFNLPTANLNLDVQLEDGVRMSMTIYLSSRHHVEAWVKGGHLLIDKLDFVKDGFMEGFMEVATFKIGLDEINYGDAHFRRTDNARAIYNPFVGNYLADAFTTEAFGEVYLRKNGFIGMLGLSNGKLNQNVKLNDNSDNKPSFYGKLGYDNYVNDDLRLRLTGSWYTNSGTTTGTWLYNGDRAGSRYYGVGDVVDGNANDFSGRSRLRFKQLTALQINPFVKYKGLEFFGIYEVISGGDEDNNGAYTQTAAELLYRFGEKEKVFIGGRYNVLSGEVTENAETQKVTRMNLGGGWFLTPNVLAKLEYVNQEYSGDGWAGSALNGLNFNGIVLEAVIGF